MTLPHPPAETHDHADIPPLRRLLGLFRGEGRELRTIVLYAIGVGLLSLVVPIAVMAIVNSVALTTLPQQLVVLCLAVLVSLGLAAFLRAMQAVVAEFLQQRLFARVVSDLAYRLPRADIREFDRQHGPELVNRFFDVLTVQKASASLLLDGVAVILQMTIGLALLATYHHLLLGFDLLLIGALLFIVFVLGRGAVSSAVRESRAKYAVAGWLEEIARHPAAFKLAGGSRIAWERADVLTREYLSARQQHFRTLLRQFGFALLLQVLASTALLGLGGWLVISEQLSLGQLVAAEIVVTLVVASFTKLGKHLESYYDLLAAADKIGHLLDVQMESEGGEPFKGVHPAAVTVRDVSFHYEGAQDNAVAGVSFSVAAGARVALTGPNGAGKSTMIDLLCGLRRPNRGSVAIDDADLRDLNLDSLRERVAVVRGIEVFAGSVLENVRSGRESIGLTEVRAALAAVGLLDPVLAMPDGMQTQVAPGGAPFSRGQAERLMLARAIAGHPRLLLLDETLDAVDESIRGAVLAAILPQDAPWTLIVATHRNDIAALCDRQIQLIPSAVSF